MLSITRSIGDVSCFHQKGWTEALETPLHSLYPGIVFAFRGASVPLDLSGARSNLWRPRQGLNLQSARRQRVALFADASAPKLRGLSWYPRKESNLRFRYVKAMFFH